MKSKRFFATSKNFLLIGLLSLTIIILTGQGWRSCMEYISYPFLLCQKYISQPIKQWRLRGQTHAELYALSERLLQERNELLKKTIEYKSARNYVADSAECLEFKKRYASENAFVAQVLLKNLSDQGHYLYLDAGENRAIQKDMVVVYDNSLVGRVSEVYPHYSKVLLVTDKECHVAASCSETGARGIHSGLNSTTETVLEFVSHLDVLHEGDLLLSHGEGLIFPRGFALGKVKSYELQGVQYRVTIEPLIDLNKLTHCLILLKY